MVQGLHRHGHEVREQRKLISNKTDALDFVLREQCQHGGCADKATTIVVAIMWEHRTAMGHSFCPRHAAEVCPPRRRPREALAVVEEGEPLPQRSAARSEPQVGEADARDEAPRAGPDEPTTEPDTIGSGPRRAKLRKQPKSRL